MDLLNSGKISLGLYCLLCFMSSSCGSLSTKHMVSKNNIGTSEQYHLDQSQVKHKETSMGRQRQEALVWSKEVDVEEKEDLHQVSRSIHSIPVEMNREVEKWLNYFTQKDRARFQRFLSRGARYREIVENVLEENGLPGELYYLAMIESGYQNHATSHASAVGVWQFIPGTGKRYGLTINKYIDERRDPIRATEAAARYLRDLYNVFGSWHLAMAGYNAGEYRVVRSIFKSKSRDFWELVRMKALPRETRNYVPKFLAAVEIGSNPAKYGFRIQKSKSYPDLQAINIPGPLSLKSIASLSGVPVKTLVQVNPHLLRGRIPSSQNGYEVWVPLPLVKHFENAKDVIAKKARSHHSRRGVVALSNTKHRVRRGENLSLIAKRYGLTVAKLKRMNGLRGNVLHPGMRLQITSRSYHSGNSRYYRVRRGDSLLSIAQRFGLTLSHLKQLNGLRSNKIYYGSRLKVSGSMTAYYRASRGDNLTKIARRFGMSVYELKKLNGLRSNRIYAGSRLKVRKMSGGAPKIDRYKVRPGDNLTKIAQRFDASVSEIKRLNDLSDSTIFSGQVLRVKR